ncbi:DUF6998 domain-containing protein [Chloroflexota bacterium]
MKEPIYTKHKPLFQGEFDKILILGNIQKMAKTITTDSLRDTVEKAIDAARRYRNITGKPLGITGEVGEFIAADLMGLRLMEARQPGYDAVADDGHRIQIKSRCVLSDTKAGQRVGSIRLTYEWDTVMLILMDADFKPLSIYEAKREDIKRELLK